MPHAGDHVTHVIGVVHHKNIIHVGECEVGSRRREGQVVIHDGSTYSNDEGARNTEAHAIWITYRGSAPSFIEDVRVGPRCVSIAVDVLVGRCHAEVV